MIQFRMLGSLDLRGPAGRPLASPIAGSKRLALLACLALNARAGGVRRDTLLGYFWPELDEARARNSLSNMLHQIRRSLGADAVVARGRDEVGLSEGVVWCDATAFEAEMAADRLPDALELYRGDLLDGLFVSGASAEFEHWLEAERARLRRQASEAANTLASRAESSGDLAAAARWARRAVILDPLDEPAVRHLILLLDGAGDRAGALRTFEELAGRLAREFDAEPAAETRAAIGEVRGRSAPVARPVPVPPSAAAVAVAAELPEDSALIRSIAVLPFDDLSGTGVAEPFAMGLHDDLLTELSRVSSLRVIARTSVMRYRGTTRTLREIGHELGVGTVLEAAVRSAGDRLRLNVQLIDVRSGVHRWAERYDRALTAQSIFELQSELAVKITRALQAELASAPAYAGRDSTANLDAYRLCAQGRAWLDHRTDAGMRRSLDFFERAVALDPDYALAWAGLADALSLLHDYGYEEPDRVLPQAEQAVRRALELAPDMAEAYTALGEFHVSRRDAPSAIAALRRAIELRSSYAEAHNWLGWMSQVTGDRVQALASAERAAGLDPMSPEVTSNLALSLLANDRAGEALVVARRTDALQPDWTSGRFYIGLALYQLHRFDEAIDVLHDLVVEWAGCGPRVTLALACVACGRRSDAESLLADFLAAGEDYALGLVCLALGRRDEAEAAFRRVRRWDYWPALSLHHFYRDTFSVIRADPLYDWMLAQTERWWRRERD